MGEKIRSGDPTRADASRGKKDYTTQAKDCWLYAAKDAEEYGFYDSAAQFYEKAGLADKASENWLRDKERYETDIKEIEGGHSEGINYNPYSAMAKLHERFGEEEEAKLFWVRASDFVIEKPHTEVHIKAGRPEIAIKNLETDIESVREGKKYYSKAAEDEEELARLTGESSHMEEAKKFWLLAAQEGEEFFEYYEAGQALEKAGESERAQEMFKKEIEHSDGNSAVGRIIVTAESYEKLGDKKRAAEKWQEVIDVEEGGDKYEVGAFETMARAYEALARLQ